MPAVRVCPKRLPPAIRASSGDASLRQPPAGHCERAQSRLGLRQRRLAELWWCCRLKRAIQALQHPVICEQVLECTGFGSCVGERMLLMRAVDSGSGYRCSHDTQCFILSFVQLTLGQTTCELN